MHRLPVAAALAGLFLSITPTSGAADRLEVPEQILGRAEKVRSPELDYVVDFRLDVFDADSSWRERSASYTMIAHGKDYSLVMMRQPEQFYSGTLLITRGLYWLLLPRSSRPFQLAPRHVLNGDISNGDLARGDLATFYRASLLGEDTIENRPCYRLQLVRKTNLAMYSKILCWIDVENFRPRRFQYFGNTGALLKTAEYLDYRKGELGVRSMRIEVKNHVRPGERTTLTFSELRPFNSAAFAYEPGALKQLRDAALALYEASGKQATAEELLAAVEAGKP